MQSLHAAALTRGRAVWNTTPTRVHEFGDVPASPATPYGVVAVDGGRDETQMLNADSASDAHRLVAMGVGKSMAELGFAVDKLRAAYKGHRLAAAGLDCTAIEAEVSGPVLRDTDGSGNLTGLLSLTLTFTFNAFEES